MITCQQRSGTYLLELALGFLNQTGLIQGISLAWLLQQLVTCKDILDRVRVLVVCVCVWLDEMDFDMIMHTVSYAHLMGRGKAVMH